MKGLQSQVGHGNTTTHLETNLSTDCLTSLPRTIYIGRFDASQKGSHLVMSNIIFPSQILELVNATERCTESWSNPETIHTVRQGFMLPIYSISPPDGLYLREEAL